MKTASLAAIFAAIAAPALGDLPRGLESARLLPGWVDADGRRITALELVLAPGWKTYWRSPGDAGIPPSFDWRGAEEVQIHWPAPDVIDSAGIMTLGYEDRVLVPISADARGDLEIEIELGLCEAICVPASLSLRAPPPGAQDSAILAALDEAPELSPHQPACRISEISDGMQIALTLPEAPQAAAIELAGDAPVWISQPALSESGGASVATSDLVPPEAKPFALDPAHVVLTLIGADGEAVEYRGCVDG